MSARLCICITYIILMHSGKTFCYKTYTALNSVIFTNIEKSSDDEVHSEYFFGQCATRYKVLMVHKTFISDDLRGKLIIRGWLNITEEPTCVYVRAKSNYDHIVRYHAMKFAFCTCRIVYHYQSEIYYYYFFEWYIPVEMMRGIVWDVYFYKPYVGYGYKHKINTTERISTL